jgi:hypothetical protein
LVESVEAFALEEKRTVEINGQPFSRLYTPVIVTTARLFIIPDDPSNISLVDGSLLDRADERKKEVPYVRFRKSLDTFGEGAGSERTVFVVNRFSGSNSPPLAANVPNEDGSHTPLLAAG